MARKEKIDNALLKRFARQETRRKQDIRIKRKYYLIVCEGTKTEPKSLFKNGRSMLKKQNQPIFGDEPTKAIPLRSD